MGIASRLLFAAIRSPVVVLGVGVIFRQVLEISKRSSGLPFVHIWNAERFISEVVCPEYSVCIVCSQEDIYAMRLGTMASSLVALAQRHAKGVPLALPVLASGSVNRWLLPAHDQLDVLGNQDDPDQFLTGRLEAPCKYRSPWIVLRHCIPRS